MKALLLGSGGWIPTERRETCCLYLVKGRTGLVVDAGTGLSRLVENDDLLHDLDNLHIVLSHFHLDHVVGLGYLPALPADKAVVLWGPGDALYGRATRDILAAMFGPPFFTPGIDFMSVDVADLREGENECGGFVVFARRQTRHPDPTFAFCIDDTVVYCSDTAIDEGNVELARRGRVLLHEAWSPEGGVDSASHSSAMEAGRLARRAGVRELVLVHIHPFADESALISGARREFHASTLGTDRLAIDVS